MRVLSGCMVNEEDLLLMRLVTLKVRLLDLYTVEEVNEWFETPQLLLQGRTPRDLLADNSGYLHVAGVIDVILDGLYT